MKGAVFGTFMRPTLVVIALSAGLGCAEKLVAPSASADIVGSLWRLESLRRPDATRVTIQEPERFTLRLDVDGRANIRADCNTCAGAYEIAGQTLRMLGPLACTRAFCASAPLDTEYVTALGSAGSFLRAGDVLTIDCAGTVLTFRR